MGDGDTSVSLGSHSRSGSDVVHKAWKVGKPVQEDDKLGVRIAGYVVELADLGTADACGAE